MIEVNATQINIGNLLTLKFTVTFIIKYPVGTKEYVLTELSNVCWRIIKGKLTLQLYYVSGA